MLCRTSSAKGSLISRLTSSVHTLLLSNPNVCFWYMCIFNTNPFHNIPFLCNPGLLIQMIFNTIILLASLPSLVAASFHIIYVPLQSKLPNKDVGLQP